MDQTQVFIVQIPQGVRPGERFAFTHLGQQYMLAAPANAAPGSSLSVRLPSAPVGYATQQQQQQQQQHIAYQQQLAYHQQAQQQQQLLLYQQMLYQQQQAAGAQPQEQAAGAEGAQWQAMQDSATGRVYYLNSRTGETRWG
jgi:hypothetical protein